MTKPLIFRRSIRIRASAAKVWAALTTPGLTKKYMFGAEAISDWKVASPLIWRIEIDGVKKELKGNIVAIEPEKRLSYTIIDPEARYPDIPENYTTVTFELAEENGETIVSISDGDFATIADGEQRYERTIGAWEMALRGLKDVAEELSRNSHERMFTALTD